MNTIGILLGQCPWDGKTMRENIFRQIEILMVEDTPGDVRLTREALKDTEISKRLNVVEDGAEAIAYLHREGKYADAPRPDLILLDLNMPKRSGREVLAIIKSDPDLRSIPVIVLTVSNSQDDILDSYNAHANAYIVKPDDMREFIHAIRSIENFWFSVVKLPGAD